jgi:hypothetical protein
MEPFYCRFIRGLEGEVKARGWLPVVADEELIRGEGRLTLPAQIAAECLEDSAVEAPAGREVANAHVDVIDETTEVEFVHAPLPRRAP